MNGSFAGRDMQVKASYASSPPYRSLPQKSTVLAGLFCKKELGRHASSFLQKFFCKKFFFAKEACKK